MNPDRKREFTPYAFGCSYFEANKRIVELYEFEEIASTFYTPKSKAWGFFLEGMKKEHRIQQYKKPKSFAELEVEKPSDFRN